MSEFIVKDSGKRQDFPSGMHRDTDDGKPRFDLLIPEGWHDNMLMRWAVHMGKGVKKYGARNWEKANSLEEQMRFRASAFRHFFQWFIGDEDEDHAAAVFFNIQGAEYTKWRIKQRDAAERQIAAGMGVGWPK